MASKSLHASTYTRPLSLTLCLPRPMNNDRVNRLLKTIRRPGISCPSLPQKILHCSERLVRPENYLQ